MIKNPNNTQTKTTTLKKPSTSSSLIVKNPNKEKYIINKPKEYFLKKDTLNRSDISIFKTKNVSKNKNELPKDPSHFMIEYIMLAEKYNLVVSSKEAMLLKKLAFILSTKKSPDISYDLYNKFQSTLEQLSINKDVKSLFISIRESILDLTANEFDDVPALLTMNDLITIKGSKNNEHNLNNLLRNYICNLIK